MFLRDIFETKAVIDKIEKMCSIKRHLQSIKCYASRLLTKKAGVGRIEVFPIINGQNKFDRLLDLLTFC
jgi:hypothetical protein